MPRFFDGLYEDNSTGSLVTETRSKEYVDVFYIPSKERLEQSRLAPFSVTRHRVKLLQIDGRNQSLTIFPTNTRGDNVDFLKPKYDQIKRITIADQKYFPIHFDEVLASTKGEYIAPIEDTIMMLLEDLPSCFVKDYDYGLGLTQPYRFIVLAVEGLSDCTEIVISKQNRTGTDERKEIFYISTSDFETLRKSINNTASTARTATRFVNSATTRNFLAEKLGKPSIPVRTGRSPLRRRITNLALRGEEPLSQSDQDTILNTLSKNVKAIAKSKTNKLVSLQRDVELVTLDNLIERYEEMVKTKLPERPNLIWPHS